MSQQRRPREPCFLCTSGQVKCTLSSVQLLSHVQLFVTPGIAAHQASLSITNLWSSPKLMSIESVMPSSHLILCRPLLLLLLPLTPPSIRVFSNESALHMRCPKYWSFSFNIFPSNGHPALIFFRMDWSYFLDQDKITSLFDTLMIPMLNPLIYSLQNKDVKII